MVETGVGRVSAGPQRETKRSTPIGKPEAVIGTIAGVYAVIVIAAWLVAPTLGRGDWPLKHDQVGYYAYLPAALDSGGLSFESFAPGRAERFAEGGWSGFRRQENGRLINPFTPGVALLQAPFFTAGHVAALLSGEEPDGFSAPYRLSVALGAVTYATVGLALLYLALQFHFPAAVAALTVLVLGLGTNLLYYATFEPLMTHVYSFAALSALMWATLGWTRRPRRRWAALAGVMIGLACVLRPTNVIAGILPVGYVASLWALDRDRLPAPGVVVNDALVMAGAAFLAALPLFAYWRYASGSWVTNPMGPGSFYFHEPKVLEVLFGYRKGWFVYTPAMLSALPGAWLLRRYVPCLAFPLFVYAAVHVYIASSYWSWWYGGSFGMRAMIETSAPLAFAVAAAINWGRAREIRRVWLRVMVPLVVGLNLFQTYQYLMTYIHWDGMTRTTYWSVFMRPWIPEEELERIRLDLDRSESRSKNVPR